MKTPTLIVRLVGLYLLANSTLALIQLARMDGFAPGMNANPMIGNVKIYASLGLLAGLAATAFAGLLARLLTFDAERETKSLDISSKLLGR